jgi:hypothetical protein
MTLTPEQKKAVAAWVASGDNLSALQKKLSDEFKLSMTYRDVRFLVDDLNLQLKDAAPKVDTSDITKTPAAAAAPAAKTAQPDKKGFLEKAKQKLGLGDGEPADEFDEEELDEDMEDAPAGGSSSLHITLDNVTLIPGALASGTVAFSDGVNAKWIVDQYGRPGFTEVSQPGYRPTAADSQEFVRQLSAALQKRGM